MKKVFFLGILLIAFLFPSFTFARIGVGVATGKISVDDKLKPGTIYELPPLTVINTGDEASDYEVGIEYHEKQPELRPQKDWFIFSPQKFHLKPGEVQVVSMKLNLPVMTEPGKYFAYLEGRPLKKSQNGQTSIGIAAATKLYFTIVPGNFFEGVYYKIVSFWNLYAPWPQRVAILIGILVAFGIAKRFFNIQIGFKNSRKEKNTQNE